MWSSGPPASAPRRWTSWTRSSHRLEREGDEFKIDHNFAVQWDGPAGRNMFLQNAARGQRGLADPNLSLNAWRSQRILDRLRGVRTERQLSPFIEWTTKIASEEFQGA